MRTTSTFTSLAILALATLVQASSPQGQPTAFGKAVPEKQLVSPPKDNSFFVSEQDASDSGLPTFYASMENSEEWQNANPIVLKTGVYSFTADPNTGFTLCGQESDASTVTDGGVYVDGKFYYIKGGGAYNAYATTFYCLDTDTWKLDYSRYKGTMSKTIATDMAFDPETEQVYAVSPEYYGAGNYWIRTVNLETGDFTDVASLGSTVIRAMAIDANGQMWGIGGNQYDCSLYKIDKRNGELTEVGHTGFNLLQSNSSATFDYRTGKLYWVGYTFTEDSDWRRYLYSYLLEVDLTTGKATVVKHFSNNEYLVGLFIKDSHPKAPEKVSGLEFKFDSNGSASGNVVFTLPTKTYDLHDLTGKLSVQILVDGTVAEEKNSLTPGAAYTSSKINLKENEAHKVTVFCYSSDKHKSLPAVYNTFGGTDVPGAITDLKVTPNDLGNEVALSWTAPAAGLHNGYIDPATLRYRIIRNPDKATIAENLSQTTFVDKFAADRPMKRTQYQVIAYSDKGDGGAVYSSIYTVGSPYQLPYLETFDSYNAFYNFTTIDANGDGSAEIGKMWVYDETYEAAMYYSATAAADDWLITPTLDLSPEKVYRLTFQTYGYNGGSNSHLQVTTGLLPTIESQNRIIEDRTYPSSQATEDFSILFNPREGDYRIGFHNISNDGRVDHMSLDNIRVVEYGTNKIPSAPTDLTLQQRSADEVVVDMSFKAPSTCVNGDALKSISSIKIYRNNSAEPIHTITDAVPGAAVQWSDEAPADGENTYVVVATSAEGDGMEATAEIVTAMDIPLPVTNAAVQLQENGTKAVISWDAPAGEVGVNGRPLNPEKITYSIVRRTSSPYTKTTIAQNLKETTFTDTECTADFSDSYQQSYIYYEIVPSTLGGSGETTSSPTVLAGKSYRLPFAETWEYQSVMCPPWKSEGTGGSWFAASSGYDPRANGQDGVGLASFEYNSYGSTDNADYISPRIDLSEMDNPVLSFYLYESTSANVANSYLEVGVVTEDGEKVIFPTRYNVAAAADGWKLIEVSLADYKASTRLSLVFRGHANDRKGRIHIDNVQVNGTPFAYDLKAVSLIGPSTSVLGAENVYTATIQNIGTETNTNFSVEFYNGETLLDTKTVESLAAGAELEIPFSFTPSLDMTDESVTLSATIKAEKDGIANNNSVSKQVQLVSPNLPYVTDLKAGWEGDNIRLSWSDATKYPHPETVVDDVEAYKPFSISNIGDWTMEDVDGAMTIGVSVSGETIYWDNATDPKAFIVFRPSQYGLTATSLSPYVSPYSGEQCFVAFASAGKANDDWMISPLLSGEQQTISFYAKAMYPQNTSEQFEVWASSTDKSIESFTKISGPTPITTTSATNWRNYEYTLPEGTNYFAIRCVSDNQFGLMIDDIRYDAVYPTVNLYGYNVFRDGVKITDEPIGETEYIDTPADLEATYRYYVSAVYEEGESIYSNPVDVKYAGVGEQIADGLKIYASNGVVRISNADAQSIIHVFDTMGRMIYSVTGHDAYTLPLSKGIYIVNAGATTRKVEVR